MISSQETPLQLVGGIDEVGWGALAGPIVSSVVVIKTDSYGNIPVGVKDSKKTTRRQREVLFPKIIFSVFDVGIGYATNEEIDSLSPEVALQLSYTRALAELRIMPNLLIVDGNNRIRSFAGNQRIEPKADVNFQEVSAASIVAKYFRDILMEEYSKEAPGYGWESNSGYGTKDHIDAIEQKGFSKYHRMRYCRSIIERKLNG